MYSQFQKLVATLSNQNVKQVVTDIVGGCDNQTATVISYSLAKLYLAQAKSQQFQDGGIEGLLTIVMDRKEWNCYYLRIYHPSNLQILLSIELCYGINELWQVHTQYTNFCILPIFKGFIGFLFPNADEARKITNVIQSNGPKFEDLAREISRINEEEKLRQKEAKEKEKGKGFLKSILPGQKSKQIERSSIFYYADSCNLKFNIQYGEIVIKDMHQDLLTLFQNARIFRKDLCDINTGKEIFKAIASYNEIVVKSAQISPQKKSVKQSSGNPSPASNKEEAIFNFPARLRAPTTNTNEILILEIQMRNPNKQFDTIVNTDKTQNNDNIKKFIEQTTGYIFGKNKLDLRKLVKEEIEKFTGLQVQNKCEFILDLSQLQKTDFQQLTNLMSTEIQKIRIQKQEKLKQQLQPQYQSDQDD